MEKAILGISEDAVDKATNKETQSNERDAASHGSFLTKNGTE